METLNIVQREGATWKGLSLEFLIDNVAVNLTGANILMQVKKQKCDTDAVLEYSTANGSITITSPLNGRFTVNPCIVNALAKVYYYDIRVEQSNGRVDYILEGTFEITQNISRP